MDSKAAYLSAVLIPELPRPEPGAAAGSPGPGGSPYRPDPDRLVVVFEAGGGGKKGVAPN